MKNVTRKTSGRAGTRKRRRRNEEPVRWSTLYGQTTKNKHAQKIKKQVRDKIKSDNRGELKEE